MTTSPSFNAGTVPLGLWMRISAAVSPGRRSLILISSKSAAAIFKASHGRNDHDEYRLLPMTRTGFGSLTVAP